MTLGFLKIAAMPENTGVAVDMLDLSGVENFEQVVHLYETTRSKGSCSMTMY